MQLPNRENDMDIQEEERPTVYAGPEGVHATSSSSSSSNSSSSLTAMDTELHQPAIVATADVETAKQLRLNAEAGTADLAARALREAEDHRLAAKSAVAEARLAAVAVAAKAEAKAAEKAAAAQHQAICQLQEQREQLQSGDQLEAPDNSACLLQTEVQAIVIAQLAEALRSTRSTGDTGRLSTRATGRSNSGGHNADLSPTRENGANRARRSRRRPVPDQPVAWDPVASSPLPVKSESAEEVAIVRTASRPTPARSDRHSTGRARSRRGSAEKPRLVTVWDPVSSPLPIVNVDSASAESVEEDLLTRDLLARAAAMRKHLASSSMATRGTTSSYRNRQGRSVGGKYERQWSPSQEWH